MVDNQGSLSVDPALDSDDEVKIIPNPPVISPIPIQISDSEIGGGSDSNQLSPIGGSSSNSSGDSGKYSIRSVRFRCSSSVSLADDVLIDIFARLPLNSIHKLRCLSKVWLSNLSNPNFITKWFQMNNKSLPWVQYHSIANCGSHESLLRFRNVYPESNSEFMSRNQHLFSFEFLMNKTPFQGAKLYLLGSSKGLVLIVSLGSDYKRRYHVCNPLTQEWVSLPPPPRSLVSQCDVHGIFCEYSSSSPYATCYKVLRIPKFDMPSKEFNVDIFSSDLGVWKRFQVSCDKNVVWEKYCQHNVVILDSVLFWIAAAGWTRILVCNLSPNNGSDGHRCSFIKSPDLQYEGVISDRRIGESEGCLCFTLLSRKIHTGFIMNVWVLEDDVNWQKLHKDIPVDNILAKVRSRIDDQYARVQILGISPVDHNVVFLGQNHCVFEFNMQSRSVQELRLDNRHSYHSARCLVSLKPMPTAVSPPLE